MQNPYQVVCLRLPPDLNERLSNIAPSRKKAVLIRSALEKELNRLEKEMAIAA